MAKKKVVTPPESTPPASVSSEVVETKPPEASAPPPPEPAAKSDLLAQVISGQNQKRPQGRPLGWRKNPDDKAKTDARPKKAVEVVDPEMQEFAAQAVSELEAGALSSWTGADDDAEKRTIKTLKAGWAYYLKVSGMPNLPGWFVVIVAHLAVVVGPQRKAAKDSFEKLWAKMFPPKKAKAPAPAVGNSSAPQSPVENPPIILNPDRSGDGTKIQLPDAGEPDLTPPAVFQARPDAP